MAVLILGVGVNDAEYRVAIHEIINGKRKEVWRCPIYRVWMNMLCRCYSKAFHNKRPTYRNCSVSEEWLTFSNFRSWMERQIWQGMELDKDLLVHGNRIYGEKYCLFISRRVNTFILDGGVSRGKWPTGVYWNKAAKKFQAYCHCRERNQHDYLGLFLSADVAHEAWRKRKHEYALRLADEQEDQRIAYALRVKYLKLDGV